VLTRREGRREVEAVAQRGASTVDAAKIKAVQHNAIKQKAHQAEPECAACSGLESCDVGGERCQTAAGRERLRAPPPAAGPMPYGESIFPALRVKAFRQIH